VPGRDDVRSGPHLSDFDAAGKSGSCMPLACKSRGGKQAHLELQEVGDVGLVRLEGLAHHFALLHD